MLKPQNYQEIIFFDEKFIFSVAGNWMNHASELGHLKSFILIRFIYSHVQPDREALEPIHQLGQAAEGIPNSRRLPQDPGAGHQSSRRSHRSCIFQRRKEAKAFVSSFST